MDLDSKPQDKKKTECKKKRYSFLWGDNFPSGGNTVVRLFTGWAMEGSRYRVEIVKEEPAGK
jgi:hypothetical protein